MNALSSHVEGYLRLRRALGSKLERAGQLLPQLVAYLEAAVERRSGFPWREAVAAPGTPMVTPGQVGSLAAAPCR